MKAATSAVLCAALLVSATAAADTFYRYRDSKTGRDVFVDRLEQVPPKARAQAKIVFESGALANQDETKQTPPVKSADDDGMAEKLMKQLAPGARDSAKAFEQARADGGSWKDPAGIAATTVNAKLMRVGAKLLEPEERAVLGRLIGIAVYLSVAAVLCAFIVWLVLVVCAFRDEHPVWGVLMLLLWPVSYFYLLLHFAKGRLLLKTGAALGLLSPTLVALWVSWRFYAWFQLVTQARGGRV
jgi:hypothetical protein